MPPKKAIHVVHADDQGTSSNNSDASGITINSADPGNNNFTGFNNHNNSNSLIGYAPIRFCSTEQVVFLKEPRDFLSFERTFCGYVRDMYGRRDIYKSEFTEEEKDKIFRAILKNIDHTARQHVLALGEDDGPLAMSALREFYLGSNKTRKAEAMREISLLKLEPNGDVQKYIELIRKLQRESKEFEIFGPNAQDMLVNLAINGLPAKFNHFTTHLRGLPKLPETEVFLKRLLEEERSLSAQSGITSVNVVSTNDGSGHSKTKRHYKNKSKNKHVPLNAVHHGEGAQTRSRTQHSSGYQHNSGYQHRSGSQQNSSYKQSSGRGRGRGKPYDRKPAYQPGRRQQCSRCLSRDGSHGPEKCPSTLWCTNCNIATHTTDRCRGKNTK